MRLGMRMGLAGGRGNENGVAGGRGNENGVGWRDWE